MTFFAVVLLLRRERKNGKKSHFVVSNFVLSFLSIWQVCVLKYFSLTSTDPINTTHFCSGVLAGHLKNTRPKGSFCGMMSYVQKQNKTKTIGLIVS